jgi:hypothetical protein
MITVTSTPGAVILRVTIAGRVARVRITPAFALALAEQLSTAALDADQTEKQRSVMDQLRDMMGMRK